MKPEDSSISRPSCNPSPLTKISADGTPYKRRPEIEAALRELLSLPSDEITSRLTIRDKSARMFIRSECLVHLIRQFRRENSGRHVGILTKELIRRVLGALPGSGGNTSDLHAATVREQVLDTIIERLAADREATDTRLDYFEIMFDAAVAALRRTATKSANRHRFRSQSIESDDDTGELSPEIEMAAGSLDIEEELLSDDPSYRLRVAEAIENLPEKQRVVMELLRQGLPIETKEDGSQSIVGITGVVEKTVRNRRDAAIRTIRAQLGIGDEE